jgi:hypothetical protein
MPRVDRLAGDGYAFETITVSTAAIGFTHAKWGVGQHEHVRAVVTNAGGVVRYRYDGSDPSATVGHLFGHGDMLIVESSVNFVQFKAIAAGTNAGILSVTYERI